jgi:hypothetical protein
MVSEFFGILESVFDFFSQSDSSVTEFSKTESVSEFSYRKQNRNRCDVLPTIFFGYRCLSEITEISSLILPEI